MSDLSYKLAQINEMQEYINSKLSQTPFCETTFKAGEKIIFINDYGVVFRHFKIIGFSNPDNNDLTRFGEPAHIHIDRGDGAGAYWFPHRASVLRKENDLNGLHVVTVDVNNKTLFLSYDDNNDFYFNDDYNRVVLFTDDCVNFQNKIPMFLMATEEDSNLITKAQFVQAECMNSLKS